LAQGPDFDVKDRVKQATDLVDLVGRYMNLRRQGKAFVGLCPFHADTKPSFQVIPARQRWSCWVCNLHGDAFDFVMRKDSVDFRGALEILAQLARIELPDYSSGPKAKPGDPNHKPTLYDAMKWVEETYHHCLLSSNEAIPIREYLSERGITDESIRKFRIGFAPLAWSWLVDRVGKTSFTPQILEACGLVSANSRGSWYERFRGRVLFPIRDTQDRPIAFGGRVVPGIYGTEDEPKGKYVNSPESKLFSKSDNLYALDLARHTLQDRKLTIVEGYTDVIAAVQAGVPSVVAALGTALNERHIRLIKRFADTITLVLDGDTAGQKRTNEILDLFVTSDVDLRILSLPDGSDPFDFCMQNGGEAFQQLIDAAPDAISHRIQTETAGIDLLTQTHAASQALGSILTTLASVPKTKIASSAAHQLRQEQVISRLARQFNLDSESVKRRLDEVRNSLRPRYVAADAAPQQIQVIDPASLVGRERELLQALILEPSFLDRAVENVAVTQFVDGPLRAIYQLMDNFFHDGLDVGFDNLMLELTDPTLRNLLSHLHEEAISRQEAKQSDSTMIALDINSQFDSVLASFADVEISQQHRAKLSQLKDNELSKEDEATALEELFKQTRQRHGL